MSRNIYRRWNEHISELNNHSHNNKYMQSAWDKYGKDSFSFYILELCEESKLSEYERKYIKDLKTLSHKNGYNLTTGGENTSIGKLVISLKDGIVFNYVNEAASYANVCPLTMIDWCKNKHNYMYLEEFNNLSEEEKNYWINYDWDTVDHNKRSNSHLRNNLSKETLEKISKSTSGSNNPRAYAVYCPQLDEKFDCIKYASDKYGFNRGSISQCIKGKLKSSGIHPITGEKLTWEKI